MFKKIICLILTAFILIGACACADFADSSPTDALSDKNGIPSGDLPSSSDKKPSSTSGTDSSNNKESSSSSGNTQKSDYITLGGNKPYKIIYETGYLSKANTLLNYLKAFDGESNYTLASDTVIDNGSCEILIGLTNRDASKKAKASLSTYLDYSITVDENKIAIYANTSKRLDDAIEYFASVLAFDNSGVFAYPTNKSRVDVYNSYPYPNLKLAGASIKNFSIIIPAYATRDEKDAAIDLSAWIAENSGYMPSILSDATAPKRNEIIIGCANRAECLEYGSDSAQSIRYSAIIKNKKLMLYAKDSAEYELALKVFTDNITLTNGNLNELNAITNSGQITPPNEGNEDNDDNENQDSPPAVSPKKAIFIGNSFIYWGGCVTYISNDASNESKRASGGDKGYFNEICKANGLSVDVYNYTYGGKNLEWIYQNILKNMSSAILGNFDYVFISEAGDNDSTFKSTVKKVASLFKNAEEIVYLAHEYTFSSNATYIKNALPDLAAEGYKIVAWGELVNDVYNGKVKVPNATLKYNKNTFIKNASSSEKMNSNAAVISLSGYGDSFHQNPLSGYITAQMCFSAVSGKSAVGQKYDFCWDSSIAPQYDLQNFLTYQYGKNQTSNFIEVFNSKADMLGLQSLMDQYMSKYNR